MHDDKDLENFLYPVSFCNNDDSFPYLLMFKLCAGKDNYFLSNHQMLFTKSAYNYNNQR